MMKFNMVNDSLNVTHTKIDKELWIRLHFGAIARQKLYTHMKQEIDVMKRYSHFND